MQTEIGSVYFDAGLAHSGIERIGGNGTRRLCRAFEVDFAIARNMRIGTDVPLRHKGESGLACREARLLSVKILGLPEWNERVPRPRFGGRVSPPIDSPNIDPASRPTLNPLLPTLAPPPALKT